MSNNGGSSRDGGGKGSSGSGWLDEALSNSAALNAELVAKKEGRELLGTPSKLLTCPKAKMEAQPGALAKLIEHNGCVGVKDALSPQMCRELLDRINVFNDALKRDVTNGDASFDSRFGGVNCRGLRGGQFGQRQDMFLPATDPVVNKAMKEAVNSLGPLLRPLVGCDARLHELSSLVSDPGAPRQCIHADTIVLPSPQFPDASMEPLYTFFIALQDVEDDMGHTVFLPQTHTSKAHLLWNATQRQKELFLQANEACQSKLKCGDVAIFDSRLLHCGKGNESNKRRVLFYFTVSSQHQWPLPDGLHGSNSVRAEDYQKYTLRDFGLKEDDEIEQTVAETQSRRDVIGTTAALIAGNMFVDASARAEAAAIVSSSTPSSSTVPRPVADLDKVKDAIIDAFQNRKYYVTGDLPESLVAPGAHFIDPTTDVVGWKKYTSTVATLFDGERSTVTMLSDPIVDKNKREIFLEWRLEGYLRLPFGYSPHFKPYNGTTTYTINDDGKITKQFETWDISGAEALLEIVPGIGQFFG